LFSNLDIDLRFDREGSLWHPDGPSLIFKQAPILNHPFVDYNSEFNGFPLSTERAGDVGGGFRRGCDQYGVHNHVIGKNMRVAIFPPSIPVSKVLLAFLAHNNPPLLRRSVHEHYHFVPSPPAYQRVLLILVGYER
jgi:hypothetical protein